MVWLVAAIHLSWIHDINICFSWSVANSNSAYVEKWKITSHYILRRSFLSGGRWDRSNSNLFISTPWSPLGTAFFLLHHLGDDSKWQVKQRTCNIPENLFFCILTTNSRVPICHRGLTWIACVSSFIIQCRTELFIHSQTSTVTPVKFGNG